MSRALVTGASGFIGTHLTEALVAQGHRVTVLVRPTSNVALLESLDVELVRGDVTDPDTLPRVVQRADVVYHLAGLTKAFGMAGFVRANQQGAYNVVEACARCSSPPVLVVVSSLAAAGPSPPGRVRTEADPPSPVSNYGRSKRLGEQAAESRAADVPVTIVRPSIVFGPHDRDMAAMFRSIARFGLHLVPSLAVRHVSLVHASDLVAALVLSAQQGRRLLPADKTSQRPGQGYYFIADNEQPSYGQLGRLIGQAVGRRRTAVLRTPQWFAWGVGGVCQLGARVVGRPGIVSLDKIREASAGSWTCSTEQARQELGFRPAASLAGRLVETGQWYARQGWLG